MEKKRPNKQFPDRQQNFSSGDTDENLPGGLIGPDGGCFLM